MTQKKCLEITSDLWNKWLEINDVEKHPDDNNDFRFHIHALQNILFANMYKNDTVLAPTNKDVAIALHNQIT